MTQPSQNKPNKPLPGGPPDRFQPKVLIVWLVIFAAIIALWSLYVPQPRDEKTLSIPNVVRALDEGRLAEVTLKSDPKGGPQWYQIQGRLAADPGDTENERGIPFVAKGRLTDDVYNKLTDPAYGIQVREQPASTLLMDIMIGLLPFVLIIALLYFLFVRQLRMAGRGAMNFGKSRAKMLTREKERATFKDVAGCDEAKEEVSEIVEFLRDPKKFQRIGGRVPKGVLMVGPPGTGKTLLARAVAGEAEVPFFSISGSDFVEMFVGVGAARVRDMFEQARKNAPCIIFIDEIDAVGRQRGAGVGGGNDEREQTLNSLLVEMDGFDGHEGIIIIAATNRPDVLDSALMRPGRFDRQITIDLPDKMGREEILRVHAKKIKMAKETDLSIVARNTPGFSGADLANLLNEAALLAARFNKKEVEMGDIDEARDKISYGRERRKLMDDEDKKITAYHEAGHAIVQAVIDDGHLPLHKVTIIPRGQSLGSTMFVPKKDILHQSRKQLLNRICCAMAGRIAEELEFDDVCSGASGDIKMATKIARHMVCDWGMSSLGMVALGDNQDHIFLGKEIARNQNYSENTAQKIDAEINAIILEQYQRAKAILLEYRDSLNTVSQALLDYETIEGKHVHEILDTGSLQSEVIPPPVKPDDTKPSEEKDGVRKKKGDDLGPASEPAGLPA